MQHIDFHNECSFFLYLFNTFSHSLHFGDYWQKKDRYRDTEETKLASLAVQFVQLKLSGRLFFFFEANTTSILQRKRQV